MLIERMKGWSLWEKRDWKGRERAREESVPEAKAWEALEKEGIISGLENFSAFNFRGLRGNLFLLVVAGCQSCILLAQPYFLPWLRASPTSLNAINTQKPWVGNTAIILYFWTLTSNWGNNSLLAKVRLNAVQGKSINKRGLTIRFHIC